MRRSFLLALFLGFTVLVLWPMPVHSNPIDSAPEKELPRKSANWMKAMEASLVGITLPQATPAPETVEPAVPGKAAPEAKEPNVLAWLGWAIAVAFFFVLLHMNVRLKRRQELLLHGDGPDLFLLPPAYNRRRRPR